MILLFICLFCFCDSSDVFETRPRIINNPRIKRSANSVLQVEIPLANNDKLLLNLIRNEGLILSHGIVEFVLKNGTRILEPLLSQRSPEDCLYTGVVNNNNNSLVAVSLCDGLQGYIQTNESGFLIEPAQKQAANMKQHSISDLHTMSVIPEYKQFQENKSLQKTADTNASNDNTNKNDRIEDDIEIKEENQTRTKRKAMFDEMSVKAGLTGDEDVFEWYDVNLDEAMAMTDDLSDLEWTGHVVGDIWKVDTAAARRKIQRQKGHIVCNGPYCEYFRVKSDDPKWLEIALYIDNSVIEFHGRETVKKYILTLINIVSAIYGDPTLGANLKFVITRMVFYEDDSLNPIVEDNSKASLENVNAWNDEVLKNLRKNERHDIAVWLTRLNIGGPSGYAPVSGVCDPERSCSLNRDEGLSSAFILAHELGHILGLSHDGDLGAGNTCSKESNEGSVMASMVTATFSYFHWSSCSAGEYHFKSNQWTCMKNKPRSSHNYTLISDKIEYEYSLDDQCRMEFDQGYSFCRSFQLSDPCAHLWCTHKDTPELCKTKKGPPMDGTACGKNKWCINGYCESTSKSLVKKDGVKHNSQPGGWSSWSSWGDCSRTCGGGVRFRSRRCDNPRPSYGGQQCTGESEEFRLCNIYKCIHNSDFRAEQCNSTFFQSKENISKQPSLWIPYEHVEEKFKCRLACFNIQTKEFIVTEDNVIDGTLCSYDHPSNICVQGECIEVGCDKILGSPLHEDGCGICAGDGTKCSKQVFKSRKKLRGRLTKFFVIPKYARRISITDSSRDVNTKIVLSEKNKFAENVFDANEFPGGSTTSIIHGSKFEYRTIGDNEHLTSRGPLQKPLVVSLQGLENTQTDISLEYTIEAKEQTLSSRSRYEWQTRGWSKCSMDCGGGFQKLIIRCYDSESGRRMKRRHCGSKKSRPNNEKRPCNSFHCDSSWVKGPWENCPVSCGNSGEQYREVYCVPENLNVTDQPWTHMVDVRYCPQQKPKQLRECNRIPCPSPWIETGWTSCSNTCGYGFKRMSYNCTEIDEGFSCGSKPLHSSVCKHSDCPSTICSDESRVCGRSEMLRYCVLPSFREKCCESCEKISHNTNI